MLEWVPKMGHKAANSKFLCLIVLEKREKRMTNICQSPTYWYFLKRLLWGPTFVLYLKRTSWKWSSSACVSSDFSVEAVACLTLTRHPRQNPQVHGVIVCQDPDKQRQSVVFLSIPDSKHSNLIKIYKKESLVSLGISVSIGGRNFYGKNTDVIQIIQTSLYESFEVFICSFLKRCFDFEDSELASKTCFDTFCVFINVYTHTHTFNLFLNWKGQKLKQFSP